MSTTATSPDHSPDHVGRLLLVDGHSMAFRAFYALPADGFTTSTGQVTNAVHGFTSMFLSLLDSERPSHVAVAFDLPGGTFRTREYADYKGTREETPQALTGQVELIQELLGAMRVPTLTAPGYEADDILATLATAAQREGMEVLICSGDRDSFQTVTQHCTVLYPVKGVSTLRRMTPEEVEARYGVPPQRYPHLAALVGEPSDNLPGVPGVGPKTAAKWLTAYDGLDGVIASADQIRGKAGQSLRDHLDDVLRNRRLNRLLTDLDLGVSPSRDLRLSGSRRGDLARVFEALEFRTLHQRALRTLPLADDDHDRADGAEGVGPGTGRQDPLEALRALEVSVLGHDLPAGSLGQWLRQHLGAGADDSDSSDGSSDSDEQPRDGLVGGSGVVGLDVVGSLQPTLGETTLLSFSDGRRAVVVDPSLVTPEDEAALARLLADSSRPKVVADAKGSWHALEARGLRLDGVVADPSLAAYLCRPEQRSYAVKDLAQRWLGIDLDSSLDSPDPLPQPAGSGRSQQPDQTALDLGCLDSPFDDGHLPEEALASARRAGLLPRLQEVLEAQMAQRESTGLFTGLEMPVAATLTMMEHTGIAVDDAVLARREIELEARVTHAAEAAFAAAGHELNLSSPKQLQTVLFDELNMPRTRRTKTGYTTDAEALAALYARTGHPFLEHLLEHRDAIKLRQTVEGLRKAVQPDGRIHTTFQQTIAATGRLSSKDPNLQNIPARTEEGLSIREAFTVGEGYECLMTADYSQIEMRIMAHLSGDEALIEAFRSGEDLHRYVAALVHGTTVAEVSSQQRSHIKAMSYGLAYGLSTFGLARQLGIGNAEAAALRDAYFARFGQVRDYLESVVEQARRDGYTQTMFGRRRYLPDLTSDSRQRREMAERAALNAPIQGSAADIVKKAMIDVDQALAEGGLASRLLLQIHDELVVEVAAGEADTVKELLQERMSQAAELSVPLDVATGSGLSWRAASH
ncbi:DNA polymerase I [Actinomyces lilanjuaniae]|uniref:DNA polymerase I n=1 Tax=Actinomyces lilanjuaniae TaxID=2321394 RepID=A0ABM6Z3V9_9ACTO|nr:DNA polymerase I [Actinomyces lilanjuaniae]AYD89842.1 DNA polymerase I [Actinomyces lilanjuaniae]